MWYIQGPQEKLEPVCRVPLNCPPPAPLPPPDGWDGEASEDSSSDDRLRWRPQHQAPVAGEAAFACLNSTPQVHCIQVRSLCVCDSEYAVQSADWSTWGSDLLPDQTPAALRRWVNACTFKTWEAIGAEKILKWHNINVDFVIGNSGKFCSRAACRWCCDSVLNTGQYRRQTRLSRLHGFGLFIRGLQLS